MEKIRYAVVGAGHIAQSAVLPAFKQAKENSVLHAIVSSDATKRRTLAKKYSLALAVDYDEYERVLDEVDAVYIALPNSLHREYTERAARAGVHVLCEKPMAVTEEDCVAMIEMARAHSVKLMVAYRLQFEAANLSTIEIVHSGKLGQPRLFSSTCSHRVRRGGIRSQGELGGGALYDIGVYCVNVARYIFRAEPVWVSAMLRHDGEVDQSVCTILGFPQGQLAQFVASQEAADVSTYRVLGTKGAVYLDGAYEYAAERRQTITIGERAQTRIFKKVDQFAPELVYFSRCILEHKNPEPSGMEGLADVRVLRAILHSAASGRAVALAPVDHRRRPDRSQELQMPAIEEPETIHAPSPSH